MFPHQRIRLFDLEQEIYRCGVDGGESTGDAIDKLWEFERLLGVFEQNNHKDPHWTKIPKFVLDKFHEFDQETVRPIATFLDRMFGPGQRGFIDNSVWHYWSQPAPWCYENNGNTPCKGTKVDVLCVIGVCRKMEAENSWDEKSNWYHGGLTDAVSLHSEIWYRDSDQKVYSSGCSMKVHPYLTNPNLKENSTRINYTGNGHSMSFHK